MTDSTQDFEKISFEVAADDALDHSPLALLQLVRRQLRGHWRLVCTLTPIIAIAGAVIGFNLTPPKYEAMGVVRFVGTLPDVLYDVEENNRPPDFTSFIEAQSNRVTSHDVLAAALDQPTMQGRWPGGAEGIAALRGATEVRHRRGDQILKIVVTHTDPLMAKTAVDAVLLSFNESLQTEGGVEATERLEVLVLREATLTNDLETLREQLLVISDEYGSEAISELHRETIQEILHVDAELENIQTNLEMIESGAFAAAPFVSAEPANLRAIDLQAEIHMWREKYGPRHPRIRTLIEELRLLELRQAAERSGQPPLVAGNARAQADPVAELRAQEQVAVEAMGQLRAEASLLARTRIELAAIEDRIAATRSQLDETRHRIDELTLEGTGTNGDRLEITALADVPLLPISDRRHQLAVVGSAFGALTGLAIVVIIGVLDPRCRFHTELREINPEIPLVTVIPDLADGGVAVDLAAHSIHRLRNHLELRDPQQEQSVYTITSATHGEGKTSVTLAVGTSFAAAGYRTLIIDADVTQASLTRELGLTQQAGLWESLAATDTPTGGRVYQTTTNNLWALPTGHHTGTARRDLSFAGMRTVLDGLRQRFDAIVIDTGPVNSSLEATVAAAVSDTVLLVVTRNQDRRLVATAIDALRQFTQATIGTVFNRAHASDYDTDSAIDSETTSVASLVTSCPAFSAPSEPVATYPFNASDEQEARAA